MTLAQYMNLETGDLRDIWDTVALATTTTHAGESSAYHPISTFLHFMAKEYFVDGGTWQITRALLGPPLRQDRDLRRSIPSCPGC